MADVEDVELPLENIRKRNLRHWFAIIIVVQIIFLVLFSFFIWTNPLWPSVSEKNITVATVKKGDFIIDIHANGILQPEIERWSTVNVSGTIQDIYVHPGTMVHKGEILMSLSNPSLKTELQKAQISLSKSLAMEAALKANLENELYSLDDQLAVARAHAATKDMRLKADKLLLDKSIISRLQYDSDKLAAANAGKLVATLQARIAEFKENISAQMQVQRSLVATARTVVVADQSRIASLQPKSEINGEVQTVSVEAGQHISAGAEICRIADTSNYIAQIHVTQSEAAEIARGQAVEVILPNMKKTIIKGTVLRISPNLMNNLVPITVRLHGDSFKDARPQMQVAATVHIGQLANAVYVSTPENARENSLDMVFVLSPDGRTATRRQVHFGLASSTGIQILSGLRAGDRVVLSDTSNWKSTMRIRK